MQKSDTGTYRETLRQCAASSRRARDDGFRRGLAPSGPASESPAECERVRAGDDLSRRPVLKKKRRRPQRERKTATRSAKAASRGRRALVEATGHSSMPTSQTFSRDEAPSSIAPAHPTNIDHRFHAAFSLLISDIIHEAYSRLHPSQLPLQDRTPPPIVAHWPFAHRLCCTAACSLVYPTKLRTAHSDPAYILSVVHLELTTHG
jgi:hypothetical protein